MRRAVLALAGLILSGPALAQSPDDSYVDTLFGCTRKTDGATVPCQAQQSTDSEISDLAQRLVPLVESQLPTGGGSGSSLAAPVTASTCPGGSLALVFAKNGDAAYEVTLSANCAYSIAGGTAGQDQRLTLYEHQPAAGSLDVGTLPSGVLYPGGVVPPQSNAFGQTRIVVFSTADGGAHYFGGL